METNSVEPSATDNSKYRYHSIHVLATGVFHPRESYQSPTARSAATRRPLKASFPKARRLGFLWWHRMRDGAGWGQEEGRRGTFAPQQRDPPIANSLRMELAKYTRPLVSRHSWELTAHSQCPRVKAWGLQTLVVPPAPETSCQHFLHSHLKGMKTPFLPANTQGLCTGICTVGFFSSFRAQLNVTSSKSPSRITPPQSLTSGSCKPLYGVTSTCLLFIHLLVVKQTHTHTNVISIRTGTSATLLAALCPAPKMLLKPK